MKGKTVHTIIVLLACFAGADAQPSLKWSCTYSPRAKLGVETELIFNADIPAGWFLYSNDFNQMLGPLPVSFTFTPNALYQLVGATFAVNHKRKTDDALGGEITYFEGKAEYRQKVKLLANNPRIEGTLLYQLGSANGGKYPVVPQHFVFRQIKTAGKGVKLIEVKPVEEKYMIPVKAAENQMSAALFPSSSRSLSMFIYYSILQFLNQP